MTKFEWKQSRNGESKTSVSIFKSAFFLGEKIHIKGAALSLSFYIGSAEPYTFFVHFLCTRLNSHSRGGVAGAWCVRGTITFTLVCCLMRVVYNGKHLQYFLACVCERESVMKTILRAHTMIFVCFKVIAWWVSLFQVFILQIFFFLNSQQLGAGKKSQWYLRNYSIHTFSALTLLLDFLFLFFFGLTICSLLMFSSFSLSRIT